MIVCDMNSEVYVFFTDAHFNLVLTKFLFKLVTVR